MPPEAAAARRRSGSPVGGPLLGGCGVADTATPTAAASCSSASAATCHSLKDAGQHRSDRPGPRRRLRPGPLRRHGRRHDRGRGQGPGRQPAARAMATRASRCRLTSSPARTSTTWRAYVASVAGAPGSRAAQLPSDPGAPVFAENGCAELPHSRRRPAHPAQPGRTSTRCSRE